MYLQRVRQMERQYHASLSQRSRRTPKVVSCQVLEIPSNPKWKTTAPEGTDLFVDGAVSACAHACAYFGALVFSS